MSVLENIQLGNLQLEQNVFSQNFGTALEIRHGNVTDLTSIYEQNTADNGAGLHIMRYSTYTGTNVTFDDNASNFLGGAVFASILSYFECSFCTFTHNQAEKGGVIYIEAYSLSEVTLSTFDDNAAIKQGGAIYTSI